MLSQAFYRHGWLCASHPWEVIIAFLTLLSWKVSISSSQPTGLKGYDSPEENKGVELVLLVVARCGAILFCFHQFLKLNKLGSTYLVGIGGIFTLFCFVPCFVFSIHIPNLFEGDFTEFNKALPFYFLLMEITKAGLLAQFALSSSNQEEVRENIAQGMSIIGPTITLDTIVETLVIGVGTLSGVRRLEELCRFACLSAIVNYLVFMIFFPACLSLILELSRNRDEGRPVWYLSTLTRILQQEEEQKPNPVLQRVKLIMSAGLVLVHAHSRYPVLIAGKALQQATKASPSDFSSQPSNWDAYMQKWFGSAEQMVMVAFACTFAVMYQYLESHEELTEHLASAAIASPSKRPFPTKTASMSRAIQTESLNQSAIVPSQSCANCEVKDRSVSFIMGDDDFDQKKMIAALNKRIQTEMEAVCDAQEVELSARPLHSIEECMEIIKSKFGGSALLDEELVLLSEKKLIQSHKLETIVQNPKRGVAIRRKLMSKLSGREHALASLPYDNYDFRKVMGSCCENVIGYVQIPTGVAGPLLLDGEMFYVPMATTEGCLVASTNRGCSAITLSGGVRSHLSDDGMTRAPVIRLPSIVKAGEIENWLKSKENFEILKTAFDSTSRYARLQSIKPQVAGSLLFLRFKATTGDAMGMNMLSKGAEVALKKLREIFPEIEIISVSGNYCTDKKPAAVNWIEGRGKSVGCEAIIPSEIVRQVLKTDAKSLEKLNMSKNYMGSALAGSIGGFNAQAANIITAIYLATGQDPAQNVTSSNCLTQMEAFGPNDDLRVSVTMPSIEVGTVGGGTFLPAQSSCLELLGVKGPCTENPGAHAAKLAKIVCATVLAGELSLMSALVEGHLVQSHMTLNRSSANISSSASPSQTNKTANL